MHPIFDADALLLLALVPASKRRPAPLAEVIIALASVRPELPGAARLRDAFARLSAHGLVRETEGAFGLTETAQTLLARVRAKGELGARLFSLKQELAGYDAPADQPAITLSAAQITDAIKAWQASLPPPTKSERFARRPGPAPRPRRRF
ncbi:MAG: hypothetical protein REI09_05745 [Candidatus Dactylopiibacterium sp.]|nr:hypothetical protein [Candidatus Dactylopiibacterium sp.]